MKKLFLGLLASIAGTSAVLVFAIMAFNHEDAADPAPPIAEISVEKKAAPTPPVPKLSVTEEIDAATGCAKEIALLCQRAERGEVDTQNQLAIAYNEGRGTKKDLPKAYLWSTIAMVNGNPTAAALRDALRRKLSARDIAEADQRAWAWLAKHDKQKVPAPNTKKQ